MAGVKYCHYWYVTVHSFHKKLKIWVMLDLLEITSSFFCQTISNTELEQVVHTGLLTVDILLFIVISTVTWLNPLVHYVLSPSEVECRFCMTVLYIPQKSCLNRAMFLAYCFS